MRGGKRTCQQGCGAIRSGALSHNRPKHPSPLPNRSADEGSRSRTPFRPKPLLFYHFVVLNSAVHHKGHTIQELFLWAPQFIYELSLRLFVIVDRLIVTLILGILQWEDEFYDVLF